MISEGAPPPGLLLATCLVNSDGWGIEHTSPPLQVSTPLRPWASCSHTRVPLSPSTLPVTGQWCPAAGRVTAGLASHWPCVTDFRRAQGLSKGDELPAYSMEHATLYLCCIEGSPLNVCGSCFRLTACATIGRDLFYKRRDLMICACAQQQGTHPGRV